jgi:hypothetical protein
MMDRRALATSFWDCVDFLDMSRLAAHLPTKPTMSLQSHQSHYLATHLPTPVEPAYPSL